MIKVYEDYKDLIGDLVDLMGYKIFIVEKEVCIEVVNNFIFIMREN